MNILLDVVFLLSLTVVVSSDTVDENGGVYNTYGESGWVDPYDLTASRSAKKQEKVTCDSDELVGMSRYSVRALLWNAWGG